MDFNEVKYNGKTLWGAVSITFAVMWYAMQIYSDRNVDNVKDRYETKIADMEARHEREIMTIQHNFDQERDQALINQRVDFLQSQIDNGNRRLDTKTKRNQEWFSEELKKVNEDQLNQWDMINKILDKP